MAIAAVECAWVSIPLDVPQGVVRGSIIACTDVVCRITTNDGVEGIGSAWGHEPDTICRIIQDALCPLLRSQPEEDVEGLWQRMFLTTLGQGVLRPAQWRRRAVLAAIGAVDLALWDIRARRQGVPVCENLHGVCHPVGTCLSDGYYVDDRSAEEMADDVAAKCASGRYRAAKIHIGRDIGSSVERVRAAVERLDGTRVMADASMAWDLTTAKRAVARLEEFGLVWLEDPICPQGGNYRSHAGHDANGDTGLLAGSTTIPLAAGEGHTEYEGCRDLAERGRISFMQFDATANGGVTEWLRVARRCDELGIAMAPHNAPHFHVHLAAAVPNGEWVQCYDNPALHPAWPDLFNGFPQPEHGMLAPPARPGWGMTINDDYLRKHGKLVEWRG